MASSSFVQTAFHGGEWSPFVQGRMDRPDYKTGMNVCLNALPIEEGACARRPGFVFGMATRGGAKARVLSWAFQTANPYNIELTDGHMRFFAGAQGSHDLVTTNDAVGVLAVSSASPAVVHLASAVSWSTGDQALFTFGTGCLSGVLAPLQNRQLVLTKVDTTHFSLTDAITGDNIDGSTINWIAGSNVSIERILDIATSYTGGSWDATTLRMIQANLQGIFLNSAVAPQVLTVTAEPTPTTDATFSFAAASFVDGPYYDPDGVSTFTPNALTGSIGLTLSGNVHQFVSGDVGRHIRLFSEPPDWVAGTAYAAADKKSVKFNGAYYTCIADSTGVQPTTSATDWAINPAAAIWSWGKITAVGGVSAITITLIGPDILYTSAAPTWRLGLFGGADTPWPTCGTFLDGRLWLSGAVPNRIDSSMSNDLFTFSPTAFDAGTVSDNNAIDYTFNSDNTDNIFWMLPNPQGIVCGTTGGEWLVQAATGVSLTPTNIQARKVTAYGCANVEPRVTGLTSVFVQRYARKLLEYFPDVFSGRFSAPNLTLTGKHLTTQGISEIAYQRELAPVVWARCGDGSLIGTTYKRETLFSSQGPTFNGWHRHELGDGSVVESVAAGPSYGGNLDTLAVVTNDPTVNVRHVQFLSNIFDVDTPITSAFFVDNGVSPSCYGSRGGNISVNNAQGTLTFYGLWHLNGKTVSVMAGGVDVGDFTVVNGQVQVPLGRDANNLFSFAFLQGFTDLTADYGPLTTTIDDAAGNILYVLPVVIGFTYTTQGQLLRVANPAEAGSQNPSPPLGKTSRAHMFSALVQDTQGVSFGTDFTPAASGGTLHSASFTTNRGDPYPANQLYSGVVWDTIECDYSFDTRPTWQVTRPYPCTVVALGEFMHTQDR